MQRDRNKTTRHFFSSNAFLVGLLAALALIALSFARSIYEDYVIRKQILALAGHIDQLKQKKLSSLDTLSYVMSSAFVEDKARMELDLKKPGEHVLVAEPLSPSAVPSQFSRALQGRSNPVQWWYYFFQASDMH